MGVCKVRASYGERKTCKLGSFTIDGFTYLYHNSSKVMEKSKSQLWWICNVRKPINGGKDCKQLVIIS